MTKLTSIHTLWKLFLIFISKLFRYFTAKIFIVQNVFHNTEKDYNLTLFFPAESQKLKVGDGCEIGKITSLMPFKLFLQYFLSRKVEQALVTYPEQTISNKLSLSANLALYSCCLSVFIFISRRSLVRFVVWSMNQGIKIHGMKRNWKFLFCLGKISMI